MITFLGNVKIETKDALKVNTESLSYNQATKSRTQMLRLPLPARMFRGNQPGAVVEAKNKKLELKKDVEITVAPEVLKDPQAKPTSSRSRPVTIRSAHATFEQSHDEALLRRKCYSRAGSRRHEWRQSFCNSERAEAPAES